jgi:Ca2+-binding RTX toxin-like protein
MPTWIANGGEWTNAANWSGGIPSTSGSTANFGFAAFGSGRYVTAILESNDIRVGIMNINLTGTLGQAFLGSSSDSGTGVGVLNFDNGGATAQLNITTLAGTSPTSFERVGGLRMELTSSLNVNVATAGSTAVFDLPISGGGQLIKSGLGRLEIIGTNSFFGGIDITGGILEASSDAALGSGIVSISNNAIFRSLGIINNAISTIFGSTGTVANAQIVAATGDTMTLTGVLNRVSQGIVSLGSATDAGTIVASLNAIGSNTTFMGMQLAGGTIRIGNQNSANLLLTTSGQGTVEFRNGAILDTGGFATYIGNLNLANGTIRTSTGALIVIVNDNSLTMNAQTGAVTGTGGVDAFTVNAALNFDLSNIIWTNFTSIDSITLNGSAGDNVLIGNSLSNVINGFGGNDVLTGNGGVDIISGGDGIDTIFVNGANGGSSVSGGANIDQLIVSASVSLASVNGFEALQLITGSTLTLTGEQFSSGFDQLSTLLGEGTIIVNIVSGGTVINGRGMTVDGSIALNVNGSAGADVVKGIFRAANDLQGNAGNDLLVGGFMSDVINGGNDIDKIRGDGHGDILTGGAGADVFKYRNISDSTVFASDIITDFVTGTDRLNFSRIDTNAGLAGDQGFAFVGTGAFSGGGAASIRYVDTGNDIRVEADVNGDGVADMHVILQSAGLGAGTLTVADFVL